VPGSTARPTLLPRKVSRGWRVWLATYALVAIAWPSAGTLPWLLFEHGDEAPAAADFEADGVAHRHHEAADVPGSPTHPLDHDCAQCKVLKHLGRCVVPAPVAPGAVPLAGAPLPVCAALAPRYASVAAERPPIRAPPSTEA
jgi:hypothetical protein